MDRTVQVGLSSRKLLKADFGYLLKHGMFGTLCSNISRNMENVVEFVFHITLCYMKSFTSAGPLGQDHCMGG